MIRINLLGQARPKAAKKQVPLDATIRVLMVAAAIVVAFVVLFVMYLSQSKQLDATNEEIHRLQAERARLQTVKAKVQEFEAETAVLQQRINVIETLQKGRTGGQELLQSVANTVERSEGVWLTALTRSGNTLTLDGEANSVNAVANFLSQLKRSGYFGKIEIKEAKEDDLMKSVTTFNFSVSAEITPPAGTTPTTTTAPAAAAPARGRS
jgi:Tfp pilus assembly protein PilN